MIEITRYAQPLVLILFLKIFFMTWIEQQQQQIELSAWFFYQAESWTYVGIYCKITFSSLTHSLTNL